MIFPCYNYQEFNNSNTGTHPKPWAEMLKESSAYCKGLPKESIMEFEGKCEASDLPSEHPYWRVQVNKRRYQEYLRLKENYQLCVENQDLLPRLFNNSTTLCSLVERLKTYTDVI